MDLPVLPPRMSGGLVALRIASSVACAVYAVIAIADMVVHSRPHTVVTASVSLVSCLICGVISRIADTVDDGPSVERLLGVLCLVPLADVLISIAVLDDISLTSFLNMTFLIFGVLTVRWRVLAALLVGGAGIWLAEVTLLGFPDAEIRQHAVQLGLRSVLAVVVFKIRDRLDQQLQGTAAAFDEQTTALARTRELHGRELSRFRTMFESGPVGIFVSDMSGRVLDANEAVARLLHIDRGELIGRSAEDFVHLDERLSVDDVRQLRELMRSEGPRSAERRIVRDDGVEIVGHLTATAIDGPDGEPWVLSYLEDITRRKAMERDLIRSRDGMRAVADISAATQRGSDPRPVAVAHLERLAGATHVSIIEPLDADTLAVSDSLQPKLRGVHIPKESRSATAHVWQSGEPLFLADAASSPLVNTALLDITGMTSMLWQPVGEPGNLLAVLAIGWPVTVEGVNDTSRDAVRTLAAELGTALTSERLRRQLEEKSRVDALTGLMNRRGWDHGVADLLAHSRSTGRPFVLAVADLDHFKQFNDEFGHLEGDILLSGFAANARATMRDVDLLSRWGGEEFAIALRDCDLSDAMPVLERIRAAVPAGRTCSIGFATFRHDETVDTCMRRADEALYRAKANGRDRIEYSHDAAPAPDTEGRVPERRRVR